MILRLKWFFKKLRIAKGYENNFRSGIEIINKRKEIHKKYLVANRNQNIDIEAKYRGWLEALSWFVQEDKNAKTK